MQFYTSTPFIRPIRLSETTREFAYESLHFKYGRDTEKTPAITLDGKQYRGKYFSQLTNLEKYDFAIEEIAKNAPIRICDNELISGAAPLGLAISHVVPATFEGKFVFHSVSHLTVDFETVLDIGIDGIRKNAELSLVKYKGTAKEAFIQSCLNVINSFSLWHERYLEALKDKPGFEQVYKNLKQKGILVRHLKDERIKDFVRITVGTNEQIKTLAYTLAGILAGANV